MQLATHALADPPESAAASGHRGILVACARATLDALVSRGHLQAGERAQIESVHLQGIDEGRESEVFETITRLSTIAPREIPDFMAGLGLAVAKTLKERAPVIPGLQRTPLPVVFADAYPELFDLARALLCPVLYSEDNEVIGVGSVNPIPAITLARAIAAAVHDRTGLKPYVTAVRLDYDSWRALLEKHFGL
jgi:hypothetical protein